jgi:hypothetical protein
MSGFAPVAVFAYRRPTHVRAVLDALAANTEAASTPLVLFSDAPRRADAAADVAAVRTALHAESATGRFASVVVVERDTNLGLARSIVAGVTDVVQRHGRVIVLEDDLVPGPYFLEYMNRALAVYADAPQVASIHAYRYPGAEALPDTFFLRGADCWGWATWARAWAEYEPDGAALLAQLRERRLTGTFDFGGAYPYTRMLEAQIAGDNDSWAVRWYASAFLRGRLTLYPGSAQVHNLGADGSGSHVDATDRFAHAQWGRRLSVERLPCVEDPAVRAVVRRQLAALKPSWLRSALSPLRRRLSRGAA